MIMIMSYDNEVRYINFALGSNDNEQHLKIM